MRTCAHSFTIFMKREIPSSYSFIDLSSTVIFSLLVKNNNQCVYFNFCCKHLHNAQHICTIQTSLSEVYMNISESLRWTRYQHEYALGSPQSAPNTISIRNLHNSKTFIVMHSNLNSIYSKPMKF